MSDLGQFSLQNKYILVTGASSGIGRATAVVLSKLGANLILAARNEVELVKTMGQLAPGDHKMILLDITNAESRHNLVDNVPVLDGIAHCAGVTDLVPFRMINEKHMTKIMDTNFNGPVQLTQRLLFKKKVKSPGSIVAVTAGAGHVGVEATAMYSASKAALTVAFKSLGTELAKQHIRVNCVAPGYVETEMLANMSMQLSADKVQNMAPLGAGKPEDVSHAVAYLLSDASRWITRATLRVDGGILSNAVLN